MPLSSNDKMHRINNERLANLTFREAGPGDLSTILHHRRSMFRDMGEGTVASLDRMDETTRPWLERALADGSYRAWLAESAEGKVVAGGGILIYPWPSRPEDPNTRRALILNVYTEPEFRRRGVARHLMQRMIGWLKEAGFKSVALHASDDGRALYEALGFQPTNEMRLRF
jgi:GNAT superfamily N-acetyltransferase